MSLQPGLSSTSFYLNGDLVDTNMLNYQVQTKSTGGNIHKRKNALARLTIVAHLVFEGDVNCLTQEGYTESDIQKWVRDCS